MSLQQQVSQVYVCTQLFTSADIQYNSYMYTAVTYSIHNRSQSLAVQVGIAV